MSEARIVRSGNVLLASPGMEDMAKNVHWLLQKQTEEEGQQGAFELGRMGLEKFPNGEYEPKILESVRGARVFLFHPMQLPDPNVCLVNLLTTCDALMRADVGRVTLVLPYMSFMRQDRRKDGARVPITARAVANLIESCTAVKQIITMDLHADQEAGFFNIPIDNMSASGVLVEDLKQRLGRQIKNTVVVTPDVGSAPRVRRIARKIAVPFALIDKDHKGAGDSEVLGMYGESVKGRNAILFDDMIDTGGTILNAAHKLLEEGAASAEIYAGHGVFSGKAVEKFKKAGIQVRVTSSIPRSAEFVAENANWLTFISTTDQLFSDAIFEASQMRGSVSKLSA